MYTFFRGVGSEKEKSNKSIFVMYGICFSVSGIPGRRVGGKKSNIRMRIVM